MITRAPRFELAIPVRCSTTAPSDSVFHTGWTRNLSETGACVELAERLLPGTRVAIVLEPPEGLIRMAGSVVWVTAGDPVGRSHVHGLQFASEAEDRDRLAAWLQCGAGRVARMGVFLQAKCRPLDGVSQPVDGWTADLGSGGCALFLPERFPVGTLLDLVLSTPGGDVPSQGMIAWARSTVPGSSRFIEHGCQFTKLRPEQARRLAEIMEGIRTGCSASTDPTEQTSSPSPT